MKIKLKDYKKTTPKARKKQIADFHGIKIYGIYTKAKKKGKDTCYIIIEQGDWKRHSIFAFVSGMWARFKR